MTNDEIIMGLLVLFGTVVYLFQIILLVAKHKKEEKEYRSGVKND